MLKVVCIITVAEIKYFELSMSLLVNDACEARSKASSIPLLTIFFQVDLSLFTLSWFLTCFVDILPHSVYLNIFDVFLYEGNKVRELISAKLIDCELILDE